jgi:hypothetical protein
MPAMPPSALPQDATERLARAGDRVGIWGSLLCALHCALLPVLFAALPALGLSELSWIDLDQAFTVFATLLGVTVLTQGYLRHRAFHAWLVMIPGLALVWFGSFGAMHTHSSAHVLVMVSGGFAIAAAHLVNLRLSHAAPRLRLANDAGTL